MTCCTIAVRLATIALALAITVPTAANAGSASTTHHGYTTVDTSTHPDNPVCRRCG